VRRRGGRRAAGEIPVRWQQCSHRTRAALKGEKGPLADQAVLKLFAALDGYIPLPERARDGPFLMPIAGVHPVTRRGTVVTGLIDRGTPKAAGAVERGQVLSRPGAVKPHRRFAAEVYVLTKEEGGRHTP